MSTIEAITNTITWITEQIAATTDDKEYKEELLLQRKAALKNLTLAMANAAGNGGGGGGSGPSREELEIRKSIQSTLSDLKFTGATFDEASAFVLRLEQVHHIYVKSRPTLEKSFIDMALQRFDPTSYKRLENKSFSTFEELKKFIMAEFSGGMSAVQMLERALSTPFDKSEPFKQFAATLQLYMNSARSSIEKQIRKKKSSTDSKTEVTTVDDLYEFIGAAVLAGRLHAFFPELHGRMANDWENLSTAASVAEKAEYLNRQTAPSSTVLYSNTPSSSTDGSRNRRKKKSGQNSSDSKENSRKSNPNQGQNRQNGQKKPDNTSKDSNKPKRANVASKESTSSSFFQ
jgi:hypothetical protein